MPWLGLYDYDTFLGKGRWMVIASYCFVVLAMLAISPAIRSFKRVTDRQAARLRQRHRCPDLLTPILSLTWRQKDKDNNKENNKDSKSKMSPRSLILAAVYPHGWKIGIAILFFVCLLSPGIPAFVCLALLLITTFTTATTGTPRSL